MAAAVSCRWLPGPGVTWEDWGLWPHRGRVSGSGAPGRSGGENTPRVNLPPVALGDLCPLPLSLGVARTSSGRLRKLGDPTGPGKWLGQPWPPWFVWGRSYCSHAPKRLSQPRPGLGGQGVEGVWSSASQPWCFGGGICAASPHRPAPASQTPAWPAWEPALCLCCHVQRPGPGAVPDPWSLVRGHWGPEVKGLASPRRWEKCVEDLLGVRPQAGQAEGQNGDVAAVLQEGMCPPRAHAPPSRPALCSRTFCVSGSAPYLHRPVR